MASTIRLGSLTLGEQIGRGGYGTVYQARISGINQVFAVKILDPSPFNSKTNALKRFIKEAEILFRLRHRHIITIHGIGEHQGAPYFLMEYFDGYDLPNTLSRVSPVKPSAVLGFVERIAGALSYAHSLRIVHRDIRPANLMTKQGDARVLDFGLATLIDPEGERITKTGSGGIGDTWSAPELLANPRLVDHRCDIFSLGACWYFILTGRAPKGSDPRDFLRKAQPELTLDYERVVLRCLDDLDRRYASADELIADIHALQNEQRPTTRSDEVTDDDVYVLGLIATQCAQLDSHTTVDRLDDAAARLSRLALGVSLRRLRRLGMATFEKRTESTFNDTWEVDAVVPTQEAFEWIEKNQFRVEDEIARRRDSPRVSAAIPPPLGDEDIPF